MFFCCNLNLHKHYFPNKVMLAIKQNKKLCKKQNYTQNLFSSMKKYYFRCNSHHRLMQINKFCLLTLIYLVAYVRGFPVISKVNILMSQYTNKWLQKLQCNTQSKKLACWISPLYITLYLHVYHYKLK